MSDRSRQLRRLFPIAMLLIVTSCESVQQATDDSAPTGNFEGVWCWGEPWRSADVPFLRISINGSEWIIETKHYMHDHFESTTRKARVSGNHLEFTYWYAPLSRWASCSLELSDDKMAGHCDGELNARQWGAVPTYLWRCTL